MEKGHLQNNNIKEDHDFLVVFEIGSFPLPTQPSLSLTLSFLGRMML
jgi:hypothetical protein